MSYYPTTSEAIIAFFNSPVVRAKHNAPELLDRYTPDMEVQINVAVDGGVPVAGQRNTWTDPDVSLCEPWFHVRNPKNAKDKPERHDWPLKFSLAQHAEGIGSTGWDFGRLCSRWFGYDFDSIIDHAPGKGVSDEDLEAVKKAAWDIPWLEIRKSTGGSGLHLYALCCDEGIATSNHMEHAALGRAILEKMAVIAGFSFSKKLDVCGGNMWVWHRKSSRENEGLKLLKPATGRLTLADIPGDWRSHLAVAAGKRATQRVIGVPEEADDDFDQLVSSRRHVPLDDEHKRIIKALGENGFSVIYQQDNHLVQAHTARLAQVAADPAFGIKGVFQTLSQGKDPAKPNCFMFPLPNGGWLVLRFSPGTNEAATWDQSGFWTHCRFNVHATLDEAASALEGEERSDGGYSFDKTAQGLLALKALGIGATAPDWAAGREMVIQPHKKSPRKLTASIAYDENDNNAPTVKAMRDDGWHTEGKRADSKHWVQVFKLPVVKQKMSSDGSDDAVERFEAYIRSLKSQDGQDAGWRLRDAKGIWVGRERTAANDMLLNLGVQSKQTGAVIARLQHRNWTLQNLPFQPEFPGDRVWNIGAQLAYEPTMEDRQMEHPHWDMIFQHLGKGLDEAVANDPWCQENGVTNGATYLLYWSASLFQQPSQKLPYLFFYGPEDAGKGTFHNALGLLMSKGHVEARNALLTQYNGELDGTILAYIEEVNLTGKNEDAFSRLKDFVTSDTVWINAKYANLYKSVSHLHWIQVSNVRSYCPIFSGDSRIVVIEVPDKPPQMENHGWDKVMKPALKHESPDFLRTLFDIQLPQGVGRLWLPVLSTQAKREAAAARSGKPANGFDANALESALLAKMFRTDALVYKALVHELLREIGKGPWSDDPAQFGKQLREIIKTGIARGLKLSIEDTNRGSEITIEEQCDDENIDPLADYIESTDNEAAALWETVQRQLAAEIESNPMDVPAAP